MNDIFKRKKSNKINKIQNENGAEENNLIFTVKEEKKGLIGKKAVITVFELSDAIEFAEEYVKKHGAPIVIKADGLAAGKGVDKDPENAFQCFKKASEPQNYPGALLNLAQCYEIGFGTKKNLREAKRLKDLANMVAEALAHN